MTAEQYEQYQESFLTYIEAKEFIKTAEDDGRKKREIEIAKKLKEMGIPNNQIREATGLTDDEIQAL